METILVVNAGSSSVKFQIFAVGEAGEPRRLLRGQMDGIGGRPKLRAKGEDGSSLVDKEFATNEIPDVAAAMSAVRD
jgi:acetate kinase